MGGSIIATGYLKIKYISRKFDNNIGFERTILCKFPADSYQWKICVMARQGNLYYRWIMGEVSCHALQQCNNKNALSSLIRCG